MKNAVVRVALAGLSHRCERGLRVLPGITHRRQWERSLVRDAPGVAESPLPVSGRFFDLFIRRVVWQPLVDVHVGVVAVIVAVDPDRGRAAQIPVVVEGPGW